MHIQRAALGQRGMPAAGSSRRALLGGGLGVLVAPAVLAQGIAAWPGERVTIVTSLPAGSTVDLTTRIYADQLSRLWDKPVMVDNRGGANGVLACQMVARARPDGLTLLATSAMTHAANPALYVAYLRAAREPISYGTSGSGTLSHVLGLMFMRRHGIAAEPVPYRGSSLALQDVAAGRLSLMCPTAGGLLPLLTGPHLRVLAITGDRRQPMFPDAPTMAEAGMPELDLSSWYGGLVPAGTPAAVIERLSALTGAALADPEIARRLEDQGVAPAFLPNPAFGDRIMAQRLVWRDIAERTNLHF